MKKTMISVTEKIRTAKDYVVASAAAGLTTMSMGLSRAFCDGGLSVPDVTLPSADLQPDTLFAKVLGIIMLVARYVGAGLLVWGLVMFAFSVKNDDAESKQKSISTMVAGVIAIAISAVYSTVVS